MGDAKSVAHTKWDCRPKAFRELGIAVPSLQEASPAVKKILEYSLAILKRDKRI